MEKNDASYYNISPIDGRYNEKSKVFKYVFSEFALMKYRTEVMVRWLLKLSELEQVSSVRKISDQEQVKLELLFTSFDENSMDKVKELEEDCNHDIKAVEYYIRDNMKGTSLKDLEKYVHFFCTSDDVNNMAYGLMIKAGKNILIDSLDDLCLKIAEKSADWKNVAMISYTHGQPATPTTLGK